MDYHRSNSNRGPYGALGAFLGPSLGAFYSATSGRMKFSVAIVTTSLVVDDNSLIREKPVEAGCYLNVQ